MDALSMEPVRQFRKPVTSSLHAKSSPTFVRHSRSIRFLGN